MVRVALCGIGFMGKTHLGVYQELSNAQLVALYDIRNESIEISSLDTGGNIATSGGTIDLKDVRKYTDYRKMLSEGGFDFVDICLPTYLHSDHSVQALNAGYHVFCEKPMALSTAETEKMLKAADESGKLLSIGQCLRFWPAYEEVKKIIDSEKYGKVRYAEFVRLSAPPTWAHDNWMTDTKRSSQAALDLHIHDADMILWLFGAPKSVRSGGVFELDGGISHISTLYAYPDRVVASTGGWITSDSFGFNMRALIIMDRATVELDFSKDPKVMLYPNGGQKTAVRLRERDGFFYELENFVTAIESDTGSNIVTGKSAADAVRLCLIEIESAIKNKEMTVDL